MAQNKLFNDRYYYQYKTSPLKYIDQNIVTLILAAYQNEKIKVAEIAELFPDAPVTLQVHHHLPYERTEKRCICGGHVYRKVPSRQTPKELLYCPNCNHNQYGKGRIPCECKICSADKNAALDRVREKFRQTWESFHDKEYQRSYKLRGYKHHLKTLEEVLTDEHIIDRTNADFKVKSPDITEHILDSSKADPVWEFQRKLKVLIMLKILIPQKELTLEEVDSLRVDFDYESFPLIKERWITTLRWRLNISEQDNSDTLINQ